MKIIFLISAVYFSLYLFGQNEPTPGEGADF